MLWRRARVSAARSRGSARSPAPWRGRAPLQVSGARLSAPALDDLGLSPLNAAASGRYAEQVLTLSSASAGAAGADALGQRARLDLAGPEANITIKGQAPLDARQPLSGRARRALSGTVSLAATVSGSIGQPRSGESRPPAHRRRPRDQRPVHQRRAQRQRRRPDRDHTPRHGCLHRRRHAGRVRHAFRSPPACPPTFAFRSTMCAMPTAISSSQR